jgi:hypothetical protein
MDPESIKEICKAATIIAMFAVVGFALTRI